MKVQVAQIAGTAEFTSNFGTMNSWYMVVRDDRNTEYNVKINAKPKTRYAVGDEFDCTLTGGNPWDYCGAVYQPAKREAEGYSGAGGSQGPPEPPHPADQPGPAPQGYRPPAPATAQTGGDTSNLLRRDLQAWLVVVRDMCNEADLEVSGDAILESARAIAIHKAIGRERS